MQRSFDDTRSMVSPTGVVPVPPMTFGKYTLVARTGRDGVADLYLAIAAGPSGFRKLVVIKRLRELYEDDQPLIDMFIDEARLSARLEHPNVIHTLDFGAAAGRHFMAMEFLEGQTLARILRRKIRADTEVPLDFVLHVAAEVLEGLHYAHELEDFDGSPLFVVHRDVTPANVMITYPGVVKVLDFGVAKAATQTSETDPDVRRRKFAYLSPDQIEGRVDRRSDLFSLGVILWEALAGRRLFHAPNQAQTIRKTLTAPIPRLDVITQRVLPEGLADLVQRALKRNAAHRFQSAAEMRAAIEEVGQRSGISMRRKDMASFMADTFSDLREQHGRDLQAAVGAGLETAAAMYEVLSPLETPALGEEPKSAAWQGDAPLGGSPTMVAAADRSLWHRGVAALAVLARRRHSGAFFAAGLAVVALIGVLSVDVLDPADDAQTFGVAGAANQPGGDEAVGDASEPDQRARRNLEDFERYRVEARDAYVAGDYAAASRAYEMATRMNPVHAGSFAGLGASELALGHTDTGLVAYQEAVRLAPTRSGFHAALGRAYRAAGHDGLAQETYREAIRLDGTNRAARRALRELEQR